MPIGHLNKTGVEKNWHHFLVIRIPQTEVKKNFDVKLAYNEMPFWHHFFDTKLVQKGIAVTIDPSDTGITGVTITAITGVTSGVTPNTT